MLVNTGISSDEGLAFIKIIGLIQIMYTLT
jgi:hypothetical protein